MQHTLGLQSYCSVDTEEPLSRSTSVAPDIVSSGRHVWKCEVGEGEAV